MSNPRSALHALEPFGRGTPEVESLLSYLCRLAVSHSTSTLILSRFVADRVKHDISQGFDWHERQLSGIRDSALTWSAGLSALTTVEGLDGLTFLPWRDVISQNGLSIVRRGQFCRSCLAEDRANGRTPYFRLAWEATLVSVCHRHRTPLSTHCPRCGKSNVRHTAAFVVAGWCTRCGEFLGQAHDAQVSEAAVEPSALWQSRQVAQLLASQHELSQLPQRAKLMEAIAHIITEMDGGQGARFARRIGIGKSTVHHWLKGTGTPTLGVSLSIASQSGIGLAHLLTGDVANWQPPTSAQQLTLKFLNTDRQERTATRELDWQHIESQLQAFLALPTPISVLEAARRLDVEARQLYLRANRTTRMLGNRWLDYLRRRKEAHVVKAWPLLEAACIDLLQQGRAVTRRGIEARVPAEVLNTVPQLLDVLKDVQAHLSIAGASGVASSTPSSPFADA
jgi:hypothetical protein